MVLIVEDDVLIQSMVEEASKEAGFEGRETGPTGRTRVSRYIT
jgi:DNA-binding response OmpR family regulator